MGSCGAELRAPTLKKRRTECDVLRPADRPVGACKILNCFHESDVRLMQFDAALEMNLREWKYCAHFDHPAALGDVVRHDGPFSMRLHSRCRFLHRGTAKDVETQIVPKNARE